MNKILIKVLIIIFMFLFVNNTYAYSGEEIELNSAYENNDDFTIKELKENIEELNSEYESIKNKIDLLKKNFDLLDFFRDDLSYNDFSSIENIYNKYLLNKENIEEELHNLSINLKETTDTENKLLIIKKDFYKNLVPFIKTEKLDEFLEFIKGDALILKQENKLNAEITAKEVILKNKVITIQEKIIEHNKEIEERITKVIEGKVDIKINLLLNSEKYDSIDSEIKKDIFNKTILKIEEKIYEISLIENRTNSLNKKLRIYNIFLKKLNDAINTL